MGAIGDLVTPPHGDGPGDAATAGRDGFVARHGQWGEEHHAAAAQATRVMEERGIELVRVAFPDLHGVLRAKTLTPSTYAKALRNGYTVPSTLLLKDTSARTVYPVFHHGGGLDSAALTGVSDIVLVPDPTTFRILPWAARTAWVLCDVHLSDGEPAAFAPRTILRRALDGLDERGWDYVTGLEFEFHVYRLEQDRLDPADAGQPGRPPRVSLLAQGFQLASEDRLDQLDDVVQLLRDTAVAIDLPLRSIESELGPSQLEVTFEPQVGVATADAAVLFRSAVKQVCRRNGYHATFMCRPNLPNAVSSGWHLHQSLRDRATGANVLAAGEGPGPLSADGSAFLAGLLAHARGAAVFTTPTVNGYKRYRPYSLAPDRAVWGRDNRGAMLRVIGGEGDRGTRIENRTGDPAANPYLYLASQVVAGLDGIDRGLDPGPPTDEPYDTDADRLPTNLMDAMAALRADPLFAEVLGADVVDHVLRIKDAEVARYLDEVSDWEQREYFDLL